MASNSRNFLYLSIVWAAGSALWRSASAQEPPPDIPGSLAGVPVPPVPGIDQFIQDQTAAVALGKAFFWDTAVGSDGQACASCHFNAGADNRLKNQVDPGLLRIDDPNSGKTFNLTATGAKSGPNYTLRVGDFPFHQFNNPDDRNSGVKFTTDDTVSSQGTFAGTFTSVNPAQFNDVCQRGPDAVFNVGGNGARKVEPRNTPTMINAAFNFRNFWDGRANNIFNGMNPFGNRDQTKRIFQVQANGTLLAVTVALRNSSLASQADGPPLSAFEMSCDGRTFAHLGHKLLGMQPLSTQQVDFNDSALGAFRTNVGVGLNGKYADLVKKAFKSAWWNSATPVGAFSLMENNFSLFWGLAIQAYEATLVSDQAPFDNWVAAGKPDPSNITGFGAAEIRGLKNVFMTKGKCINCHKGPEFSGAASLLQAENEENGLVERMLMGDGGVALYDNGFYNIGVTRTNFDVGVGGTDPIIGQPLSFTEQYREFLQGQTPPDPFQVDPCTFAIPFDPAHCSTPPPANFRAAVNGAFKVPSLRNVELTGPYMHNGGMATLEQVVQFYNRGGNFQNPELDPDIQPLGLTTQEKSDLIAFLKSLTDLRVRFSRGPFDHPQIKIFNGHPGNQIAITQTQPNLGPNLGADDSFTLVAVGKFGAGNLVPFQPAP